MDSSISSQFVGFVELVGFVGFVELIGFVEFVSYKNHD
jgi:hypothetical protein